MLVSKANSSQQPYDRILPHTVKKEQVVDPPKAPITQSSLPLDPAHGPCRCGMGTHT